MFVKSSDVPPAYNGQSVLIELVNKQLHDFVANGLPVMISGEKGIGKYRAASWVYNMRTATTEKLPLFHLQSVKDLQEMEKAKPDAAYVFTHESFAVLYLDKILAVGIPQLYIGIISTQPFRDYSTPVNTVHIPALRERVLDIPILTQTLLNRLAEERGEPAKHMHETELQQIQRMKLLGNMVELKFILSKWLETGVVE